MLESQKVDRAIANKIYEFSIWILLLFFLKFRLLISKRQCKRLLRKDEQRSSIKRKRKKKTSTTSFGTNFLFLKIHLKKYTARQFDEKPKNIADVSTEDGYITVWGDVLKTEVRETKRGTSKIFDFDISDYTSSITVKMFDDKRVIDPLVEKINEAGTLVRFRAAISLIHFQINMFFALTNNCEH